MLLFLKKSSVSHQKFDLTVGSERQNFASNLRNQQNRSFCWCRQPICKLWPIADFIHNPNWKQFEINKVNLFCDVLKMLLVPCVTFRDKLIMGIFGICVNILWRISISMLFKCKIQFRLGKVSTEEIKLVKKFTKGLTPPPSWKKMYWL